MVGVLEAIFAAIGVTKLYFVEFGCEDVTECNATHLLEQGWRVLFIDGANVLRNPQTNVRQEFITAENVNTLFEKHDVPETFDLLSTDIDGNDY